MKAKQKNLLSLILRSTVTCAAVLAIPPFAMASYIDSIPKVETVLKPIETQGITVTLNEIVNTDLVAPNQGIPLPGANNADLMLVSDQIGKLWVVNVVSGSKYLLLDIGQSGLNLLPAFNGRYSERGLLSIALHPDFLNNGLFYTYQSEPSATPTNLLNFPIRFTLGDPSLTVVTLPPSGQTTVREWRVTSDKSQMQTGGAVDPNSRVVIIIDQTQTNHEGGTVAFGPDNMLYLSLGDGGGADDDAPNKSGYVNNLNTLVPGSNPGNFQNIDCSSYVLSGVPCDAIGNAQDTMRVLGKILRIDPNGRTSANGQYSIPRDNPYFSNQTNGGFVGCQDGICDEIYASGLRNPFRFSWDVESNQLIAGDVGQLAIEEVNIIVPGGNYGWAQREGSFCFDPLLPGTPNSFASQGIVTAVCDDDTFINPVVEYQHENGGISVLGGYIYRGAAIPGLNTKYVFADYAKGFNFATSQVTESGRVLYTTSTLSKNRGKPTIKEFIIPAQTCNNPTECNKINTNPDARKFVYFGLGLDSRGEIYVMGNWSGVAGPRVPAGGSLVTSGFVKKIVKK